MTTDELRAAEDYFRKASADERFDDYDTARFVGHARKIVTAYLADRPADRHADDEMTARLEYVARAAILVGHSYADGERSKDEFLSELARLQSMLDPLAPKG